MNQSGEARPMLIAFIIALVAFIFFVVSLSAAFFANRLSADIIDMPLPSRLPLGAAQTAQPQTANVSPTVIEEASSVAASAPSVETTASTPQLPTATPRVAVIAPPAQETPPPAEAASAPTAQASEATAPSVADVRYKRYLEDSFDSSSSGWPVRNTPTSSTAYITGTYQLTLYGQRAIVISAPIDADVYKIQADVILKEGTGGLTFLSGQPATYYRVLISTSGTFAVQKQEGTERVTDIVAWAPSPAIEQGTNAVNRLQIERRNDQIAVSANDQLLTLMELNTADATGQFGFVLASETGLGTALFDNLVVDRAE